MLGARLPAGWATLTNRKLEQNRQKLFPKPLLLLYGAGLSPVPGPVPALQRGGRRGDLEGSPVTPTWSP